MKITNYLLYHDNDIPYETIPSPNFSNYFRPEYLVLHCTTGFTVEDGVRSLIDPRPDRPDLRVSAHLVIGREGRVVQLVPFNKCAWHCGPSLWNGIKGLNSRAIGIELVNAGDVERDGLGQWVLFAARAFRAADLYAGVVLLGVIGFLSATILGAVERYLLRWRVTP